MCKLQLLLCFLTIFLLTNCTKCSCNTGFSGDYQLRHLPGYLKRHMQPEEKACKDFYEHACGGWEEAHAIRPYRSQMEQLDYQYHRRLATLLEAPALPDQPRFVQLLRNNYNACRRQHGHYQAADFVRFLATWGNFSSLQEQAHETDYSKLKLLFRHLYPFSWPQELGESERESNLEAVQWLMKLQLPWSAIDDDDTVDTAEFMPLTREQFDVLYKALLPGGAQLEQLWVQVQELERQISELSYKEGVEEVAVGEETGGETVAECPPQYKPGLSADAWLLALPLVHSAGPLRRCVHFNFHRMRVLLAAQPTPLLLRYVLLRLLHSLQLRATPSFGRQKCAAQTRHLLTHASVWLMQQQQTETQRQLQHATVQQLFEQLRQRFKLQLQLNRNGFRRATQRFLLDKLRRMRLHVSVLPQTDAATQRQLLELHYANLQLSERDYYGNLLATLQQIEQWRRERNDSESLDVTRLHLLQSNGFGSYASPFFLPDRNVIFLPDSLLATPIYRPHQATVLTQSSLGFLIAHEMSHGFTPTDIHYDGRGIEALNPRHLHILGNRRFQAQLQCLLRNPELYFVDSDEKFADFHGLYLAYETFNALTPLSNDTLRQAFFLNFAQFFCQDDSQLEDSLVHGGSRKRVNDAVANLESFAQAFSCKRRRKHICRFY